VRLDDRPEDLMRFILPALLLCFATAAQADQPPVGALKADWLALMATKCDLDAHGVRTPIEASVLRNTPYAMQGYTFKTAALGMLFDSDGEWYVPKPKMTPKFSPAEGACIKKIKAFEAAHKKTIKGMKRIKTAFFVDRGAYFEVRGHSKLMAGTAAHTLSLNSNYSLEVRCPKCTKLQIFTVMCSAEGNDCGVLVPGMGMLPQP
jgi:hypothetical protein